MSNVDKILVAIDEDYGYPTQEWMDENGYHVVVAEQHSRFVRSGKMKFVITNNGGDYFTYTTNYISDGVIVWHTSDSVVEATRCYRKVKMVESYYYVDDQEKTY